MKRLKPTTILEYVLLILLAGLFLFPMIWMVVSAMKPEADVYKNLTSWKAFLPSFNPADWFKPYQEVLARFSILTYLGNSIFYAGTFALGSIIVNALAGFAFAKINFTGKKILFGFLLALLIIPMETVLIPQFTIINSLGLVNNRLAVIIPGLASVFNYLSFPKLLYCHSRRNYRIRKNRWCKYLTDLFQDYVAYVETGGCNSWCSFLYF